MDVKPPIDAMGGFDMRNGYSLFLGIYYYLYGMAGNHIRTALFTLSWFILDARMLKDGYNMKSYDQINKRGFTIAELLIIAAIVGFLVAVSIPLFTAQLEKTRETVDIHTMRTAASLGQQFYYAGVTNKESAEKAGMQWWGSDTSPKSNAFAIYIPDKGAFSDKDYNDSIDAGLKAYGKGTKFDGGKDLMREGNLWVYDPTLDYTNAVLQVSIFPNGSNKRVEVAWKKLQKGNGRPFIGNGEMGKDGYEYSDDTYPRMVIYLN